MPVIASPTSKTVPETCAAWRTCNRVGSSIADWQAEQSNSCVCNNWKRLVGFHACANHVRTLELHLSDYCKFCMSVYVPSGDESIGRHTVHPLHRGGLGQLQTVDLKRGRRQLQKRHDPLIHLRTQLMIPFCRHELALCALVTYKSFPIDGLVVRTVTCVHVEGASSSGRRLIPLAELT